MMLKKRHLDVFAKQLLGVERRPDESDWQLRERCARKVPLAGGGMLVVDEAVTNTIAEHIPVYASVDVAKVELAMHWFRPAGLSRWGRFRWALRVFFFALRGKP